MPRLVAGETVIDYFDRFKDGDVTIPAPSALLPISRKLDAVAQRTIDDLLATLRASPEHRRRVQTLLAAPRTSGSFARSKIILDGASPFEQSAAIQSFLEQRPIQRPHTWFVASGDDCVPVRVNKPKNSNASMMHVVLGATKGDRKAPKYEDWAINDPTDNARQKVFVKPLTALEIVRQPGFSAATVMKDTAFADLTIDSEHRYGSECACVEDKGQSKNTPKKQRSAGLNACKFVEVFADESDPQAEETDICDSIQFEDFAEEGEYRDDLDLSVTAGGMMKAAEKAIVRHEDSDLERLMHRHVVATLGVPETPSLRGRMAQLLLE